MSIPAAVGKQILCMVRLTGYLLDSTRVKSIRRHLPIQESTETFLSCVLFSLTKSRHYQRNHKMRSNIHHRLSCVPPNAIMCQMAQSLKYFFFRILLNEANTNSNANHRSTKTLRTKNSRSRSSVCSILLQCIAALDKLFWVIILVLL